MDDEHEHERDHKPQHEHSDDTVTDDIGDAFNSNDRTREPGGQTPSDEIERVREKANAKIGQGGETGMSGAEAGTGITGGSSGTDATVGSDLNDEGLDPRG